MNFWTRFWSAALNKRLDLSDRSVLDFISKTLFPPPERKMVDGTEFFADSSVDANLEAVLCDVQDAIMIAQALSYDPVLQKIDARTLDNLRFAIENLQNVRKQYQIFPEIKSNNKKTYFMVTSNRN